MADNTVGAQQMRAMGEALREVLPKGLGFALLVFATDNPGLANYISNCDREDMIKALRETADRLEKGQIIPTPESN